MYFNFSYLELAQTKYLCIDYDINVQQIILDGK